MSLWYYDTQDSLNFFNCTPQEFQALSESEKERLFPHERSIGTCYPIFQRNCYLLDIDLSRKSLLLPQIPFIIDNLKRSYSSTLTLSNLDFVIRFASMNDLQTIKEQLNEMFWKQERELFLVQLLQLRFKSLVITFDNKIVGAILCNGLNYIEFIYVLPAFQRKELSKILLQTIMNIYKNAKFTLNVSVTNYAIQLYTQHNFKAVSYIPYFFEQVFPPNHDQCRHAYLMEHLPE
ncbi:hypothetical protein RCL1_000017 [Eukaryota sp. TZLM3-RCL]